MQTILTVIIVALCTAYALWCCYRVLRRPPDSCAACTGCPMKSHCTTASYPFKTSKIHHCPDRGTPDPNGN